MLQRLAWVAFFFILPVSFLSAQMPREQQQAIVLKRMIERYHYSPRPVNDSFSSDIFKETIRALAQPQFLLSAAEYKKLEAFRYSLDEELQGGSWAFLNTLTTIYTNAIKRADSIVNVVMQKPLDFSADDRITLRREPSAIYPATTAEMQQLWTRYFKYGMLNNVYDLAAGQTPRTTIKEVLAKNEAALRQKMKKSVLSGFQQQATTVASTVQAIYLNALSTAFDPHTVYLSPDMKENFQASLSTEGKSFGFFTGEKEGKTIVMHLVPGGPAWKSGAVHRNDQLLQLKFDNKELHDITLLSPDEVEELLAETTATTVQLKIKKTDGSLRTVDLRKEKIETGENSVRGFVLKGPKKIGYISLPDFYTVWEDESGSSCADDVAREIVNLKKEGIEGLILDVRFNGGGSMQEALQLTGIFINEGPLFGVRPKDGKVSFLKDPNRGTIWDGPMLVMINGQSASASEALAASLQDYNRALVAGSPSYGKATMQVVLPMDTTTTSSNPEFGFVKVTTGKLYRLNGNTNQLQGVKPDVYLPDVFDAMDSREKGEPHALPADTVKRNSWYKPLQPLPLSEAEAGSSQRQKAHAGFTGTCSIIRKLTAYYKTQELVVPLKPEAFEKWRTAHDESITTESKEAPNTSLFTFVNHPLSMQRMQNDSYAMEMNTVTVKQLQQDFYLEEAYHILSDLIQKTTNK